MTALRQDTTSFADINGGTAAIRAGGRAGRGSVKGDAGADEVRSGDLDRIVHADEKASKRVRGVAQYEAMPNGEFAIRKLADLRKAINTYDQSPTYAPWEVIRHIVKRARALGYDAEIPDNFLEAMGMEDSQGRPLTLQTFLVMEGDIQVVVQEAPSADNGNRMRVKVPFYIGESVARAPGFDKPIHFPTSLLPGIIQEGKDQIAAGKQPLTIYARHNHAMDGNHLPIGSVVDLMQEGRVGYSILDLAPTGLGRDAQVLVEGHHINAVSLRSGPGMFAMETAKVNGTLMLEPTRLKLAGIDLAPDSPAQDTYGMEILTAEARVESWNPKLQRRSNRVDDFTLEDVRAQPRIVQEIERPLRAEIETLAQERDAIKAERDELLGKARALEVREYVREIAAKFPDAAEAETALLEYCTDCKTREEVAAKAMPVLLQGLSERAAPAAPAVPKKPANEVLMDRLFRVGGAGQGTLEQLTQEQSDDTREVVFGLPVPD